jgi:hypothetical protein
MRSAEESIKGTSRSFLRVYYGHDADKLPDFDPSDPDPSPAYALGAKAILRAGQALTNRVSLRAAA